MTKLKRRTLQKENYGTTAEDSAERFVVYGLRGEVLLDKVRAVRWPEPGSTGGSIRVFFLDGTERHCQVDVERTGSAADAAMTQPSASGTRHLTPDSEGTGA